MMFGAQWYEVVTVVLVKVVDVAVLIRTLLCFDVMHFINVFIAQRTLGKVEVFVVFTAFFLL